MNQPTLKPFSGALDSSATNKPAELTPFDGTLDGEEPKRSALGHVRDLAVSGLKGAIAIPETVVGLADMATGGKAGKFLENEGGSFGLRFKQAREIVNDMHTDAGKLEQQEFQQADGIVDKAKVALKNPHLIAGSIVESVPTMIAGGVVGRGLMGIPKLAQMGTKGAAIAGAAGEGVVGAGSAAEQIRQQTDDGLLTGKQTGLAAATGVVTGALGALGGKVANRLGIGDADTMMAQGMQGMAKGAADQAVTDAVNPLLAQTAKKSILRQMGEGAISEGVLEELPQSVSEQILQNEALSKPWSEGLDEAIVMGILSGGTMGAGAAGFHGYKGKQLDDATRKAQEAQAAVVQPAAAQPAAAQPGVAPAPAAVPPVLDHDVLRDKAGLVMPPQLDAGRIEVATGLTPLSNEVPASQPDTGNLSAAGDGQPQAPLSERMGLNPSAGGLTKAAALAVDSGASPVVQQPAAPQPAASAYGGQEFDYDNASPEDRHYYDWEMGLLNEPDASMALAELDDSDIPWDSASNVSEEDFLRYIGASDEEIQNAIQATNQSRSATSNPQGNAAAQTNDAGKAGASLGQAESAQGSLIDGPQAVDRIQQLEAQASAADGRAADWASRDYKANSKPLPEHAKKGGPGDVQEANEQRRLGEISKAQSEAAIARKQAQALRDQANNEAGSKAIGANVATLAQLNRKTLPDMSRDELQQLASLLPANHERQKKIEKALQTLVQKAPEAIETGAKSNVTQASQAQQGSPQSTQAGSAQASVPAAQGVTTNATPAQHDGAQAGATTGTQGQTQAAPEAPAPQQAAVTSAEKIAQEGNAQREQQRQRLLDASERWTRMTGMERQALAQGLTSMNVLTRKNVHTRSWADLSDKVRGQLADGVNPQNTTLAQVNKASDAIESEAKNAPVTDSSQTPVKQTAQPVGDEKPFAPETGTLGIPRADMPQVPTANHGGLVKHLNAQGIAHETKTVDAADLKPTQAEYSPSKVEAAKSAAGDRAVVVSSDGHIIDGHHQAVAAAEEGKQVKAIVLDAPVEKALEAVKASPSTRSESYVEAELEPDGLKDDQRRSIKNSEPVNGEALGSSATGWRESVQKRVGKWGVVDNSVDNAGRITLVKGQELRHFYYRKGSPGDQARAMAAAEAWAKEDSKPQSVVARKQAEKAKEAEVQAPVADGSQTDSTSNTDPNNLSMEQRDLGRQSMTDVAAIQLDTETEASTIAVTNGVAKFRQGKHNGGHGFGEEFGSFDYLPKNRFNGSQFRISFNSIGQYQVIEFLGDETEKKSTGEFDKTNWRADAIRIINEAIGKKPKQSAAEPVASELVAGGFPMAEAVQSYSGISHTGRTRADGDKQAFDKFMESAQAAAEKLASTDAQREALAAAADSLRADYLQQYRSLMNVRAGTYSGFVAGRANLNSKQANSRNNALDKAMERFDNWVSDNADRLSKAVLNARTPEQLKADRDALTAQIQEKADKKAAYLKATLSQFLSFKSGDNMPYGKSAIITRVSYDKDGYPSSLTFKMADGSPVTDDKLDLVPTLKDKDETLEQAKARIRAVVDEVRAENPELTKGVGAFRSAASSKAVQNKEKIAKVSADYLNGAVKGDTITASADFEYVTGGKPMLIEDISLKGEVHVFDPVGGGRTSFRADMATARRVTFVVEKPAIAAAAVTHLDRHNAIEAGISAGTLTLADYQSAFAELEANQDAVMAELNKLTKDKLLRAGGPAFTYRMKDDKKDAIVMAAYQKMLDTYALGRNYGPSSYFLSAASIAKNKADKAQALREMVSNTTAEDLAARAAEIKAARDEFKAQRDTAAEALANPKSLQDFRGFMRHWMDSGETMNQAYLRLNPEQRQQYDALEAAQSKDAREAAKRRAMVSVASAGDTTAGEVIATKHTKHGHDLFVVKLAERVERDAYDTLNSSAKRLGGSYSSYRGNGAVPGFQFRTRDAAEAFQKLVGGDTAQAQELANQRRDAFDDDKSQSAAERLRTMAEALDERASEALGADRKANTARRARFAASADAAARTQQALAGTMRNIAQSIEAGTTKFLDGVRQRVQVEYLMGQLRTAKSNQLQAKYPSYADQMKRQGEPMDSETVDFAAFPTYEMYRSDWANLARQLLALDGGKKLGATLARTADDVTEAYIDWAKENLLRVSHFGNKLQGGFAEFASKDDAERAIKRSGLVGKAVVLPIKRGQNRVVLSPSEAMQQGLWQGDGDKRMTIGAEFIEDLMKLGKRKGSKALSLPWQLENAYENRQRLQRMGILTRAEFRSALRELASLQQEMATPDRIKELERSMVGRANDGLDFFPTSPAVVQSMLDAAEIAEGMAVLEPSAGMGHIADAIVAESGVWPDVVELSSSRRELLEAKGFHLAEVDDFTQMEPRRFFTYGDTFRAPDGVEGTMRGVGGMGSQRVRLEDAEGNRLGLYDRSELVGVAQNGTWSGYDRIIMNPPFSDGRDIAHVQHAYNLLRPGGRIVAIMGESAFFQSNKRAEAFRDWLDERGATNEKLPDGSFMDPSLPVNTGVAARMVVIDKPAGDMQLAPRDDQDEAQSADQTDTAAFKRWFGDSKVVDAEGKPMVVYHGTRADFQVFGNIGGRFKDLSKGFYFTTSTNRASVYADSLANAAVNWRPESSFAKDVEDGANVVPVYLRINNPLLVTDRDGFNSPEDAFDIKGGVLVDSAKQLGHDGIIFRREKGDGFDEVAAIAFKPDQIKSAIGNNGNFNPEDPSIANFAGAQSRRPASAQDKAVMQAIAQGKSARDVFRVVANGSKNPFLRQVARMLLKTGITPSIEFGHIGKSKGNPIHGQYRGRSDTIAIAGSAEYAAERIFMHEAMHAATMRALAKPGLPKLQLQKLLAHVKKQKGAAGFYGTTNVDEFVAEVFTNPDFQAALRKMNAPAGGSIKTAWDGFVRILRSILGLPNDSTNALSQALNLGVAAMREDMGLRKQGVRGATTAYAGTDNIAQTDTVAFKRWFGDSKVVNAEGKPLVVYRGQYGRGVGQPETKLGSITFSSTEAASGYALESNDGSEVETPHVIPAYLSIKNPVINDPGDPFVDFQTLFDALGKEAVMPILVRFQDRLSEGIWENDPDLPESLKEIEAQQPEKLGSLYMMAFPLLDDPEFVALAKKKGYDGAIHDGYGDYSDTEYRVFDEAQIKSSIGNNGNFDPEDPSILNFGTDDFTKLKTSAMDQLNKTFSHEGKVSLWHKTVGTMGNLAKNAPAFKPVFESAQQNIDDISMLANDAADTAPRLLPRVDDWRDLRKAPVSAEDNKAIAKPLFEGTLIWGRDENGKATKVDDLQKRYEHLSAHNKAAMMLKHGKIDAGVLAMWQGLPMEQFEKLINSRFESKVLKAGIVWSDSELQSLFGANAKQISLYREARAAIDRSIDMTARTDMLRVVGDKYEPMREAVLEQPSVEAAAQLLLDTLELDAKADPDSRDRLAGYMQLINRRLDTAVGLQKSGYAPLSRFGRYTVDVVDANGERQFFGMYESQRDSNLAKIQLAQEFKGATITQGTMSAEAYKLFAGVTPETLEQFGEMLGLKAEGNEAQDKAFQEFLKLTKNNHSAMKRMIHRQGIAGFSEDVGRVVANFVYSNARAGAMGLNAGKMDNAINEIPKEQGELKDLAMGLRSYIRDPQDEGQAVRGMLFAQYLGGSLASAFVNTTQPFAVTLPWLTQYGGMKKAAVQLSRALKDMATKGLKYESDLAKAMKDAEDDGTLSPQEIHQLMSQARGAGSLRAGDGTKMGEARAKAGNLWVKGKVLWGQPFALAEQFNRRSTFIAAFRTAKEQGIANPNEFARNAVIETQFQYSKANKPRWARGVVGGTLFTFKTYSVSYLELMHRTWNAGEAGSPERAAGRRAVLWAMAMLLLMSGAGGVPFMEDAEDLIDGMGQLAGYNISAKQWRKQAMADVFGKELAELMEQGVSGLPGAPVDVSGRLGMGNLLPGTGLFLNKPNRERDLMEMVGPAGDLISRGFTGARKLLGGDVAGAALQVSPTAIRNLAKGADMAATGMYRDTKGYKVIDTTLAEAVAKAVGFQPKPVAEVQEANSFMLRSKSFYIQTSSEIKAQWADALFRKDEAALADVRERLADWNRDNLEQPIVVKMPDVWKKVREMGKDRTDRIADTAPKALRTQMQEIAKDASR